MESVRNAKQFYQFIKAHKMKLEKTTSGYDLQNKIDNFIVNPVKLSFSRNGATSAGEGHLFS